MHLVYVLALAGPIELVNPRGRLNLGTERLKSTDVALGDIDGDGDLDAAVAAGRHWAQPNTVWLLSKGYTTARPLGDVWSTSFAVRLIDLDQDGDLDALTGNDGAADRIWHNDGTGRFTHAGQLGTGEAATRDLLPADFTGDGIADVLALHRDEPDQLCIGPDFTHCTALSDASPSVLGATCDIDGDGDLDAIVAQRGAVPTRIYENDGMGSFTAVNLPGTPADARSVACGDLDGDGHPEVVEGVVDGPIRLWRRAGDGWAVGNLGKKPAHATDLALVDLDADTDLDIVVAAAGRPSVAWLNGPAWKPVPFGGKGDAYGVAAGLVNGDNLPDVVLVRSDGLDSLYITQPGKR